MRSCIKSTYTAVRHFAVAVPAQSPVIGVSHFGSYLACLHFAYKGAVATNTIFLYHCLPWSVHLNHLWFQSESEHRGVAQTVVRFEIVFAKNVVVRHVTIVTHGIATVRRVHPRSVLRLHNMAVHTRLWVIRKIRMRLGKVKYIPTQAQYNSYKRRNQIPNESAFLRGAFI